MSIGSGHFEFRLFISEVKPHDFHEYKLTVANEVDGATTELTLLEGKYTALSFDLCPVQCDEIAYRQTFIL